MSWDTRSSGQVSCPYDSELSRSRRHGCDVSGRNTNVRTSYSSSLGVTGLTCSDGVRGVRAWCSSTNHENSNASLIYLALQHQHQQVQLSNTQIRVVTLASLRRYFSKDESTTDFTGVFVPRMRPTDKNINGWLSCDVNQCQTVALQSRCGRREQEKHLVLKV